MKVKRNFEAIRLIVLLLSLLMMLSGCGKGVEPAQTQPVEESGARKFAMVAKDVTNPYMTHMFSGFTTGCGELDTEATLVGPSALSAEEQAKCIDQLIEQRVDAIAVAANDKEVLSDALRRAIDAGIQVVSLDSSVNVEDRMVHIQQAAPDILGRVLVQAAREMIGGSGQMAVLTTTETAPNQSLWVSWMYRELEENPENYAGVELVEVAYGCDEYETSRAETMRLLEKYPDLDIIIAPTSVGIYAAAEAIGESGAEVKVTGLGLPSEMAPYILDGSCPWMYLWNPIDVGYVTAYACAALADGAVTGTAGEILHAGMHGDKRITACEDGGTEIVVGNPYMFDQGNIAVWQEIF